MKLLTHRLTVSLALAGLLGASLAARAADTDGLDLTIEVLGKHERVDERIVNRIEVPGIRLNQPGRDAAAPPAAEAALPPVLPPPLERPLGLVQDLTRDALELLRLRQEPAN